jgi:hypothetical protein
MNCTVGIAADSEEELLEAAGSARHGGQRPRGRAGLREEIKASMKETEAAAI